MKTGKSVFMMAPGASLPNDTQCPDCGFFDTTDPRVIQRWQVEMGRNLQSAACTCPAREERKAKDLRRIWANAGLPKHKDTGQTLHFGNFDDTRRGTQEAFAAAQTFANGEGSALLGILGIPGSGKSHLAEAVVRFWINHYQVQAYYNSVPHLLDTLRLANSPRTEEEAPQMLLDQKEASLIVLDDIGQDDEKKWVRRVLGDLVDYRYRNGLWTVVTSNMLDKKELGEATDKRISSRLWDTERSKVVMMTCGDYRALTTTQRAAL